ncbi:uncharacterized protein LOC143247303 [Tachypleus tridentatus]|uniref:uncharacterized protein LOC143247303 n=1 Tax=Tachypleus tridentatus TaxID=6853 RepID=UPI003FD24D57
MMFLDTFQASQDVLDSWKSTSPCWEDVDKNKKDEQIENGPVSDHLAVSIPPTMKKLYPTRRCRICSYRGKRRDTRTMCRKCFLVQQGLGSLELPHYLHPQLPSSNVTCKICHKKFHNQSNLRRHMRKHSPYQMVFQCDVCLRTYTRKDTLKAHRRLVHGNIQDSIDDSIMTVEHERESE